MTVTFMPSPPPTSPSSPLSAEHATETYPDPERYPEATDNHARHHESPQLIELTLNDLGITALQRRLRPSLLFHDVVNIAHFERCSTSRHHLAK